MLTSKYSPRDTAGLVGAGRRRANRRRPPGDSWEVASWSICQRLLSHLLAVAEHAARLDVVTGGLLHGRSLYPRGAGPTWEARPWPSNPDYHPTKQLRLPTHDG